MRKHLSLGIVLTAVVFVAFLAACGSSGDGGLKLTNYYDGEVGAAAIENTTDAEAIVGEAYGNSGTMSEATGYVPLTGLGATALSLSTEALTAEASFKETIYSDVGCTNSSGSAVITLEEGVNSGSISIKFNNYCETTLDGEEYINGSIYASASDFDLVTGDPTNLKFTIPSLSVQTYDTTPTLTEDMSMSGRFTAKVNGDTIHLTQNMTAKDNISGESFKVKDYDISILQTKDIDGNVTEESVTINSGTFYHSEHGYVSIATESPLVQKKNPDDPHPTSGVIVLTGANNSSLKLDFGTGDLATAYLSVDLDGDETYEIGPITIDL